MQSETGTELSGSQWLPFLGLSSHRATRGPHRAELLGAHVPSSCTCGSGPAGWNEGPLGPETPLPVGSHPRLWALGFPTSPTLVDPVCRPTGKPGRLRRSCGGTDGGRAWSLTNVGSSPSRPRSVGWGANAPTPRSAVRVRITYSECLADVRRGGGVRRAPTNVVEAADLHAGSKSRHSDLQDRPPWRGRGPRLSETEGTERGSHLPRASSRLTGRLAASQGAARAVTAGGAAGRWGAGVRSKGNKLGTSWAPASGRVGAACQAAVTWVIRYWPQLERCDWTH